MFSPTACCDSSSLMLLESFPLCILIHIRHEINQHMGRFISMPIRFLISFPVVTRPADAADKIRSSSHYEAGAAR